MSTFGPLEGGFDTTTPPNEIYLSGQFTKWMTLKCGSLSLSKWKPHLLGYCAIDSLASRIVTLDKNNIWVKSLEAVILQAAAEVAIYEQVGHQREQELRNWSWKHMKPRNVQKYVTDKILRFDWIWKVGIKHEVTCLSNVLTSYKTVVSV